MQCMTQYCGRVELLKDVVVRRFYCEALQASVMLDTVVGRGEGLPFDPSSSPL